MIRYEIDDNGFLTGNWAKVGGFDRCIEIDELKEVDRNLRWNGSALVLDINPKILEEKLQELRKKREIECFTVINRGQLWYNRLSEEQKFELNDWYNAWLDVTEIMVIPEKPNWLEE